MASPSKKRSWEGHLVNNHTTKIPADGMAEINSTTGGFQSIFETFRSELDEHHDRRERIVKASRDITALSKKIIFSLQRIRQLGQPLPPPIAKETHSRFEQILELFRSVTPDITGTNAWRYQRQLSPGIQEFVEAVSFREYVQSQRLITLPEISAALPPEVLVTEEDYLLGLFDLTGEMMRLAITTLSAGNAQPKASTDNPTANAEKAPALPQSQANIVVDLRTLRARLEELSVPRRHAGSMLRDMHKKVEVMQNSVEKVERAAYGILVRGSERPSGWTPDLSTVAGSVEVESY